MIVFKKMWNGTSILLYDMSCERIEPMTFLFDDSILSTGPCYQTDMNQLDYSSITNKTSSIHCTTVHANLVEQMRSSIELVVLKRRIIVVIRKDSRCLLLHRLKQHRRILLSKETHRTLIQRADPCGNPLDKKWCEKYPTPPYLTYEVQTFSTIERSRKYCGRSLVFCWARSHSWRTEFDFRRKHWLKIVSRFQIRILEEILQLENFLKFRYLWFLIRLYLPASPSTAATSRRATVRDNLLGPNWVIELSDPNKKTLTKGVGITLAIVPKLSGGPGGSSRRTASILRNWSNFLYGQRWQWKIHPATFFCVLLGLRGLEQRPRSRRPWNAAS